MGSMTDERRKEMEEEMMRFELEIAVPGDDPPVKKLKPPTLGLVQNEDGPPLKKPKIAALPPPPPPPTPPIVEILPTVLKPPPPPPPPPGAGDQNVVHHKPMLPPQLSHLQPPRMGNMQFIPHQVQRQPPRPPRPNMMQLRPPGFHGPGPMPFPPMQNSLPPPMPMPMPPMGMPMPMPPTFCPPPPGIGLGPMPPQSFVSSVPITFNEPAPSPPKRDTTSSKRSKTEPATVCAPVMYTAAPTKNVPEKVVEGTSVANGQTETLTTVNASSGQQAEEPKVVKSVEDPVVTSVTTTSSSEPVMSKKEKKKKKIVRMAGGQAWEDNSLIEWDPDDFRIFCGDLGNDVTDEVLIRAFSKYQSFVKAKVIRDKRTNKTKGYGFVSFKDPQDFIKAMREMNGRYVGSRPIKLRKSTWRDRNIEIVRKKQKEKEKLGLL